MFLSLGSFYNGLAMLFFFFLPTSDFQWHLSYHLICSEVGRALSILSMNKIVDNKKNGYPKLVTGSVDGEKNAIDSVSIILICICFNCKLTI